MASVTLSASATAGDHSTVIDNTYVSYLVDYDWSTLGNMAASDDAWATANCATTFGGQTYRLDVKNFGFAIPSGATIDGVVVSVERGSSNVARPIDEVQVRLVKAGTPTGDNKATGTITTEVSVDRGGASDLWGTTLSADDVNNAGFGVALQYASNTTTLRSIRVDLVSVTVYYTEAAGDPSPAPGGDETTFGRIPLVVVEIDQEVCANVYGLPPCGASIDAAESSLKASWSVTASANSHSYVDMTGVSDYVIQSGDYVEYDIFWLDGSVPMVAFDYTCSDTTTLRASTAVDQNGLSAHPNTDLSAYAAGAWYHRKIQIDATHVGKTVTRFDLACEADVTATHVGYARNINITNGSGTTRKAVWNSGDALPSTSEYLASSAVFSGISLVGDVVTGATKCFNTRASCQDAANYAAATTPLTLRFCEASADIPVSLNVIPNVKGVTTSPTRLNPGGRTGRDKPLGRRAECTVRFIDHPHSDNLVDPYLADRTYNPLERGTFWAKWVKRNPYHNNWPLRVYEGYYGQTLAQMQVRNYLIDKVDGPDSNGSVSIRAVDVLRLADNDKAQCPALSTGKLSAAITSSATSLTIAGTLAQYTAYSTNVVRIEKEIIRYTGISEAAGIVTLTGLTRGSDGTTAAAHDVDDSVQACKEWVAQAPWLVAKELLIDFGAVPTAYVPYTDWTTECGTWLSGMTVTRLISEPTGVTTLLGELSEQCTFYIWWDEYAQEVKLRAVRPVTEAIPLLTEADHLLQNSVKITPHPEYRASEVWVSYLQRNAADLADKRDNYRRTSARIDGNNFYGERRVYEVFSPWLTSSAAVDMLTFRLLSRYRNPPRLVSFALDAKDRSLRVGDVFDFSYRGFTDLTGQTETVRYQVVSAHESPPGERVLIEAQKFDFDIGIKYGFWVVNTAPLYSAASEAEKATGFWWTGIDGTMPDGSDGYVWS